MPLDLSDITICAADCLTPALAARALEKSMALCRFGDALLFSDTPTPGAFRTVPIDKLRSKHDYSRFLLKDLAQHIRTPFVLVAQWDGYVIDAGAWQPEFTDFDYIGARWPQHQDALTIGNGGFSLRSMKLLRALNDPQFQFIANVPEDDLICRVNHTLLTSAHGIQFAPEKIAMQFSYEWETPAQPTFGFHSLSNFWRHVDDTELVAIADLIDEKTLRGHVCMALMVTYYAQRKLKPWNSLYARLRRLAAPDEIAHVMTHVLQKPAQAAEAVQTWDRMLAAS